MMEWICCPVAHRGDRAGGKHTRLQRRANDTWNRAPHTEVIWQSFKRKRLTHPSSESIWFRLNSTMSSGRIAFPARSASHLEPDARMPTDRSGRTQLSLSVFVVFWGMARAPWSAASLCLWKMSEPSAIRLKGLVLYPSIVNRLKSGKWPPRLSVPRKWATHASSLQPLRAARCWKLLSKSSPAALKWVLRSHSPFHRELTSISSACKSFRIPQDNQQGMSGSM